MENLPRNRNALSVVTNQPNRNDLLAKICPITSNKPNLILHLTRANSIPISSGLKILTTRIQSNDNPSSYHPLVTISDNDQSDEDDFVLPSHKLTNNELREELKIFCSDDGLTRNDTNQVLLVNDNDDDTGDIEFRTHQPVKHSICCYQYMILLKERFCTLLS